jgi:hypothetical protein
MKATTLTLLSLALPSLAGAQTAPHPLWGEVIDGNHSTPLAVVSDGLGGAFIGGTAEGSFGGPGAGGIDAFVEHRDAAGRSTFLTRFGAAGDERVVDLVADGAGGVYVIGAASGPLGGVGSGVGFAARFDALGNRLWLHQFEPNATDVIAAARVASGELVIATYTLVGGGARRHTITRLDGAGSVLSTVPLASTSIWDPARTQVADIAAALGSNIWVAWHQPGFGNLCLQYDDQGRRRFTPGFGSGNGNPGQSPYVLAEDGYGGIFVAQEYAPPGAPARIYLRRESESASTVWVANFGNSGPQRSARVVGDGAGGCVFVGAIQGTLSAPSTGTYDWFARRFDPLGNVLWTYQESVVADRDPSGVALGPDGDALVTVTQAAPQPSRELFRLTPDEVGVQFCAQPQPNSAGLFGELRAVGSSAVQSNRLTLAARDLPLATFGYFLNGTATASTTPPGSAGILCLGGAIGRFNAQSQVFFTGTTGSSFLQIDLSAIPTPTGFVVAAVGQIWHFQAWHRDVVAGSTSGFTNAATVSLN